MAPIPEDIVDDRLKEVIQDLYEIQSATHGYLGPETTQVLVSKVTHLTASLSALSSAATGITAQLPPEIIQYIEEGRNPDIYTREFVELVQRGNAFLKGKSEAFASFRDVLAEEIRGAFPGLGGQVGEIVGGVKREAGTNGEGNGEGLGRAA